MLEMLLLMQGGRVKVTQSFPQGSSSFTTSSTMTLIDRAVGKGQDGTTSYSDYGYDTYVTTTTTVNGGTPTVNGPNFQGTTYYADPPEPYCNVTYNNTTKTETETCYDFQAFDFSTPGETGAGTTAFGLTFPGGSPDTAATMTAFDNLMVTPSTAYSIYVAPGGALSITYWK